MASMVSPMPAEIAATRGPSIVAANLTVAILATIAVTLRLLARNTQRAGIKLDDKLMLLALPLAWAMCIGTLLLAFIKGVHYGLGRHIITVPPPHLVKFGQVIYATQIIWAAAIFTIKASILALYVRIFGPLKYLRYLAYAIGIFVACWALMVIFGYALQCHPVEYIWEKTFRGTCINVWLFSVIGTVLNVITDFGILVLPIPAVCQLNMSTAQKISVIGTLLLGSLACVISVVRLAMLIESKKRIDPTWANSYVAIWSTAEPCLGIVAACLPTFRPLFFWFSAQKESYWGSKGTKHLHDRSESNSGGSRQHKLWRSKESDNSVPLTEPTNTRNPLVYGNVATGNFSKDEELEIKPVASNVIQGNSSRELSREVA